MKIEIEIEKSEEYYHAFIYLNNALSGNVSVTKEEYIELWGLLQFVKRSRPHHYKIEFKDDIFWDEYNQEVKKDDRI